MSPARKRPHSPAKPAPTAQAATPKAAAPRPAPRARYAPRPGTGQGPRPEQGRVVVPRPGTLEVRGQWTGPMRSDGPDLNELDDEDQYTQRFAGQDAWYRNKDGEIVDIDPVATGGAELRAYQLMISNGYDYTH